MSTPSLSPRSSNESLQSTSSAFSSPDKLSPTVTGPMVWEGAELTPTKYVIQLSNREIQDIRAAVIKVKIAGTPRSEIRPDTFDLGNSELAGKLSSVSKELHQGLGVVVLRGLDAANFNDEEAIIAFAGVCSYICPERATDSYANQTLSKFSAMCNESDSNHLLGHVRDATKDAVPRWAKDIGLAGSKITTAMDFHSDRFSGDILALHVRNDGGAGAGGEQYIVSFWKIYNELLEKDPEVLETMAEANWPFELKQKDKAPYLELGPTLLFSKGKPMCQLVKAPLLGTPLIQRDPSMPVVTAKQMHAMHAVEELAKRFCTTVDRQRGDIQLFNNLSIMHARGAYRGTNNKASTRHLLRMFLRDPENAWEKPARFRNNFDDPFALGRPQNLPVLDNDPWRLISGRESHG
ncbi:Clavaminate synthase-like protein [Cucurbitaria berberidis CBS 394.84]|uniref:Clavaminate synthase-like protein n=1 Tax=Cucurbitaria berberidis CBS 394.84 TaxID=1168544 RepID=A0A9P4GUL6_9PLEO|nr:Clavaminate synthase-like protein [Cucurbitaria berberidis CBS 394.84]KAF1852075.1 Clavaminate synthase-like protein [Cucurbitaria berberidis CBS 394.84]